MSYVVDDTIGVNVGPLDPPVVEKKFPWATLVAALPAIATFIAKK